MKINKNKTQGKVKLLFFVYILTKYIMSYNVCLTTLNSGNKFKPNTAHKREW